MQWLHINFLIEAICVANWGQRREHRYYLLVFKQQSRISKDVESRERFDVSAFARQNGLGEPVAASFFRVERD
ncbi:hypothetical protein GCK32_019100 [Trichostrongylus colubriformis]|uniref:Uncharacterized protein n=1 Tax=Trichostrongylus colubriformis TaxID=6319 RepID=A0AAN8F225_TRICO